CASAMQFSSVLPLDGKACMSPVRRGSGGYGSERMRINCCSIRRNKALRRMCFSARGAVSSTQCVLTSDAGPDTLVVRTSFRRNYADPNEVAAVPIGGCYRLIDIPMSNCFNSGINKIFVMTQFNSASLNRHIHRTYLGGGINFTDGSVEVLAATQMPGEAAGWFQGTADAVRKFIWVLEDYYKHKAIEHILILSGDQLCRMDYMELVQRLHRVFLTSMICSILQWPKAPLGRCSNWNDDYGVLDESLLINWMDVMFLILLFCMYQFAIDVSILIFMLALIMSLPLLKTRRRKMFHKNLHPKSMPPYNVSIRLFAYYWLMLLTILSIKVEVYVEHPPSFEEDRIPDHIKVLTHGPRYIETARVPKLVEGPSSAEISVCQEMARNIGFPKLELGLSAICCIILLSTKISWH
ncbi:hypothetical protein ACJX0J_041593, partial [Zea mays]